MSMFAIRLPAHAESARHLPELAKLVNRAVEWYGEPLLDAETFDDVEGLIADALDDPMLTQLVLGMDRQLRSARAMGELAGFEPAKIDVEDIIHVLGERHRFMIRRWLTTGSDFEHLDDERMALDAPANPTEIRSMSDILTDPTIPAELVERVYDGMAGHPIQAAILAAERRGVPLTAERADHLVDRLQRALDSRAVLLDPHEVQAAQLKHAERQVVLWKAAGEALESPHGSVAPFGPFIGD